MFHSALRAGWLGPKSYLYLTPAPGGEDVLPALMFVFIVVPHTAKAVWYFYHMDGVWVWVFDWNV